MNRNKWLQLREKNAAVSNYGKVSRFFRRFPFPERSQVIDFSVETSKLPGFFFGGGER